MLPSTRSGRKTSYLCDFQLQAIIYAQNYSDSLVDETRKRIKIKDSMLACKCKEHVQGVSRCDDQHQVYIKPNYWAGNLVNNNVPEPHKSVNGTVELSWEDFHSRGMDIDSTRHEFATALCANGKCAMHGEDWPLAGKSPCLKYLRRTGVLCGRCENGTQQMLGKEASTYCSSFFFLKHHKSAIEK